MGICGRSRLKDIIDEAQIDTVMHKGELIVSKATVSSVCSQDAFRLHVCPSSQGDRRDFESAVNVNFKSLEEGPSNHNRAAGMWVYHDHRLRPKANRKSFPSGSVIFSIVRSPVSVLQCFINGFKTLSGLQQFTHSNAFFKDALVTKAVVRRN